MKPITRTVFVDYILYLEWTLWIVYLVLILFFSNLGKTFQIA